MAKPVQTPKKGKTKKKKNRVAWLLIFLALIFITLVCAYISYNYAVNNSFSEDSQDKPVNIAEDSKVEFTVEKGANTSKIAQDLKAQGFIKNENIFKLLSKFNGYDGMYKSGTHYLSKDLSYDDIMRVLTNTPASVLVTIPEGKNFKQIVDILYDKKVIADKEKFIKIANTEQFDYPFLKGLPQRDNRLEGYLFPDTYKFNVNASEEEVIKMMLDNFQNKFKETYLVQLKNLPVPMTVDKVITLASIVEREAKSSEERPEIAGVFYNRMVSKDQNLQKLQSCATIQYILLKTTGSVKERLLDTDLQVNDPYNTYMYKGLPPGPICSPGDAAIKAVLYPDKTPYYYFVSKGDAEGTHQFSKTFKEHQAAIKKYGLG